MERITYYILYDELEIVRKLLDMTYTETCGILIPSLEDEAQLTVLIDEITISDNRKSCRQNPKSSEIEKIFYLSKFHWHTHSSVKNAEGKESKGYPSAQDIFKAIKNKRYNILFSSWGAWSMYSTNPLDSYYAEDLREDFYRIIKEKFNSVLYKDTEEGRMKITSEREIRKIQKYIDGLIKYINKNYGTDIHIKFDPWYKIEDQEYFAIN